MNQTRSDFYNRRLKWHNIKSYILLAVLVAILFSVFYGITLIVNEQIYNREYMTRWLDKVDPMICAGYLRQ